MDSVKVAKEFKFDSLKVQTYVDSDMMHVVFMLDGEPVLVQGVEKHVKGDGMLVNNVEGTVTA